MRRWWLSIFVLPVLTALYACGGAQPVPEQPKGDVCPVLDAGPPPVCPEGCTWDGEACRKHSGIIVIDATTRDGGRPRPVPSAEQR